jgi:FAD/FMN-containing dehydrogenase
MGGLGLESALGELVGAGHVLTDAEVTVGYGTAWAADEGVVPAMVVLPGDAAEAGAVLRACGEAGVAVVLQGGNTGLVRGGVPAGEGEVVLSTRRMSSIEEVDEESLQVVVGAGVTLETLQARLAPLGLELPIDLAARSQATVGGMAATNAGGARAFRHGTMRRLVVGIEAVLADGSVVERLGGVMKDSTGYDWPSLLVGSEGTLALITRLRLRVRRVERSRAAALVPVDSVGAGLGLATGLRDAGAGLEAAEFVMPGALRLVRDALDLPDPFRGAERSDRGREAGAEKATGAERLPSERVAAAEPAGAADGRPLVLLESRAAEGALELLAGALANRPEAADAVLAEGAETARLWRYREGLGEALARHEVVKLDVALPLARLADGLDTLERAAVNAGGDAIRPYLFGHLLDGNVHVNLGAADAERRPAVEHAVLEAVLAAGGSIGAEHGIGRAKATWLAADRSPADIAAMRAVKAALDPAGLLAPGVLLPPPG